ncbi:MAG: signal peptidase I [Ornithinimicrobium sp.]
MGQRRRSAQPDADAASGDTDKEASRGRAGGGIWSVAKELISVAAIALVISFLIKTFVAQAFWIPSGSMEDTLVYGDRVIVSKVQAGPLKIGRGDIVVFEDPDNWLPHVTPPDRGPVLNPIVGALEFVGLAPTAEGNHLIKRVIGLGGDRVRCCDAEGRVSVNGQTLNEQTYLYPGDEPSAMSFDVTVPKGRVWVMGDHRSISGDSRVHDDGSGATGSIPDDRIVGQAVALVWPLSRFDWFQAPSTLTDVAGTASSPRS